MGERTGIKHSDYRPMKAILGDFLDIRRETGGEVGSRTADIASRPNRNKSNMAPPGRPYTYGQGEERQNTHADAAWY